MDNRILDSDSIYTIAEKIFNWFEVNQSCTIEGYIQGTYSVTIRGMEVMKEIERLDIFVNTQLKNGKPRRKRVILPNSVGGYVAQKIFKYKKGVRDGIDYVSIWRYQ